MQLFGNFLVENVCLKVSKGLKLLPPRTVKKRSKGLILLRDSDSKLLATQPISTRSHIKH